MRKTQMVAAILAMVALLLIAAACGSDEASTETADLNTLAPEQVFPAPQEVREEPAGLSSEQAARQKADRNDPPAPDLTHGSRQPPVSSGSPLQSLKFGDVDYVYSGYAELPSGEGTVFVIDGIEISLDVLEMVGTAYEGRTAGIHEGLAVYRLKDDRTTEVYTFRPGEDHVNPEDGQIFKGKDVWTRWTTG